MRTMKQSVARSLLIALSLVLLWGGLAGSAGAVDGDAPASGAPGAAESGGEATVTQAVYASADTGVLLAGDSFGGAPGALHLAGGGRGWSEPWQVQNSDTSVPGFNVADANALHYPELYQEGNYAIGGTKYLTAYRSLDLRPGGPFAAYLQDGKVGRPGQTLWLGALLRKDQNNGTSAAIGFDWPNTKLEAGFFGNSSTVDGTRYWGLSVNGTVYNSSAVLNIGEAALLVLKIEFGSPNRVSLFVNPSPLGPGGAPAANLEQTVDGSIAFTRVHLSGGEGNPNQFSVDEIRLGTGYAAVTPTFLDTEPPAAPGNLQAIKVTDTAVTLAWEPAQDNVGVTGYRVYRDGVLSLETAETSALVKELNRGTTYAFAVKAIDGEGNESAAAALEVTTDSEPADPARYHFENGETHGFKHLGGSPATVTHDGTRAYAGEGAVKIAFAGGSEHASVGLDQVDPLIGNGKTVSFMVYIPDSVQDFSIQPFLFGAGWTWNGSWYDTQYLKKNDWNKLEVTMSQGGAPSPWLGFFIHSANPGEIWLDSVTYTGYGQPDTEPPTAPGGLKSVSQTDETVTLTWNEATDNVKVTQYAVYVNGQEAGTTAARTFQVFGLQPATAYEFTVTARDEAGNESAASEAVAVTTDDAHVKLTGTPFGSEPAEASSTFDRAFDGDTGTSFVSRQAGYVGLDLGESQAKRPTKLKFHPQPGQSSMMAGGKFQGSRDGVAYETIYSVQAAQEGWNEVKVVQNRAYRYMRFIPAAGRAVQLAELAFYGVAGDANAPSAPTGFHAAKVTETTAELAWTPSQDDTGVVRYRIERAPDGALMGTSSEAGFTVKGLAPGETYRFVVLAEDGAGNRSEPSLPVEVTTTAAGVTVEAEAAETWVTVRGAITSGRGQEVTIEVLDPAGRAIHYAETVSGFEGSFLIGFPVEEPEPGTYTVLAGGAGAAEPASAVFVFVTPDTEPPTGSAAINGGAPFTNDRSVTVAIEAADADGTVSDLQWSADGGTEWSDWTAFTAELQLLLPEGDGDKEVLVRLRDAAGNSSEVLRAAIVLDTTAPVIELEGARAVYDVHETVNIACRASDALSGIASASCEPVSGLAYDFGTGSHTYAFSAADRAGNDASANVTFTVEATYAGVKSLTASWVADKGLRSALAAKLDAAAASDARGNTNARDGQLGAFINQVKAQMGKKIDAAHAEALIALAEGFSAE